jgi:protein tyrosine phosphatase (PTP) superfamily phosphohydrolase (DUF442 family)
MTNGSTTGPSAFPEPTALAPVRPFAWRRRAVRAAFALVAFLLLAAAWWSLAAVGIRTITEGRVYQSGVLAEADLREAVRRLGIRSVIDVRQPLEEVRPERELLSALGVRHIHIPTGQVPDEPGIERFLEVMSDPATYPVLIHCHHGVGRSVLFSALYRIEFEGWDREQARRAALKPTRRIVPGGSFAVDGPKGAYLLGYAPRRARQRTGPRPREAAMTARSVGSR